jgi:hypothetical protein
MMYCERVSPCQRRNDHEVVPVAGVPIPLLYFALLPNKLNSTPTSKYKQQVQKRPRTMPADSVKAQVQYLASADEGNTATYYASQAGVDQAKEHDGQFQLHAVEIQNGRKDGTRSVDIQGFQFLNHVSSVTEYHNDTLVKEVFYEEVKDILLQNVPGAKRVEIFDHTRRASTADLRKDLNCREPSAIIHNDYTAKSANKRLNDMLPDEAQVLSKKRFAIVNLWRSIAGTVQSVPMAFCDSTSIDIQQDLVSVKRLANDRIGELQMALHSPRHRWYYFPLMTSEEAVIFKTFDSEASVNQFTLHTALDGVGDASVPRQSIEIRAFVFFE